MLKLNAQGLIPSSHDLGMDISVGGDATDWTDEEIIPVLGVVTDTLPDSLIVIPETQQTLLESSVVPETLPESIPETLPESIVPETLPELIVSETLLEPIVVCVPLPPQLSSK